MNKVKYIVLVCLCILLISTFKCCFAIIYMQRVTVGKVEYDTDQTIYNVEIKWKEMKFEDNKLAQIGFNNGNITKTNKKYDIEIINQSDVDIKIEIDVIKQNEKDSSVDDFNSYLSKYNDLNDINKIREYYSNKINSVLVVKSSESIHAIQELNDVNNEYQNGKESIMIKII